MFYAFVASLLIAVFAGFALGRDRRRFFVSILPLALVLAGVVPAVPVAENFLRDRKALAKFRNEPQFLYVDGEPIEGVHAPDRSSVTFTFPDGSTGTLGAPPPWHTNRDAWHEVRSGAIFGSLAGGAGLVMFGIGRWRSRRKISERPD